MTRRLFNFGPLFSTFAEPVIRIPKGTTIRDYTTGGRAEKTPGLPEEIMAIVTPLSDADLRMDTGGNYRRDDQKIYVRLPIVLEMDDQIQHKGTTYRVMTDADYRARAGFARHIMRHAAAGGADPLDRSEQYP